MFKRRMFLILVLCMLVSILPTAAHAEAEELAAGGSEEQVISEVLCITCNSIMSAKGAAKASITDVSLTAADFPNNPPADVDTVNEKVAWIAQLCRQQGFTDEWDIARWLHDWLVYNANYDYSYTYYHSNGVLLNGTGVCNSYTEAYQLLLNAFSIENRIVSSREMNHAWNLVKLNGQWCHVDCTWDDPAAGTWEDYYYFGMSDEMMSYSHSWPRSGYPAAVSDENYYLIHEGFPVARTPEEMELRLHEMFTAKTTKFQCYYIGQDETYDLFYAFYDFENAYNWKYGIDYAFGLTGYFAGAFPGNAVLYVNEVGYTDPWEKPANFDQNHAHYYYSTPISPNCVEEGYTLWYCLCEDSYKEAFTPAVGHQWNKATCAAPKTCAICGVTEGTALDHSWKDATCTTPKTCVICGVTEGATVPHVFDQEVTDDKYLVSEGTGTSLMVYKKSCKCGEAGEETFAVRFKDVPRSAYFYDATMWAVENEITSGTGDGTTFEPNAVCTRGQVVTFLWRAAGQPEPVATVIPFKDVKESDYFYKAVLWAVEKNITKGTGDGTTFEPNAYCNRGQIVTFLSRAKNGQASNANNPFKDVAGNAYYYNAVLWAVKNGITTGTGDGSTFEPNADCTRGQVITFLWRAYTK